jgi:uncharacterized protein with von Willebrand factor type A (vWA) domain
MFIDFFHLLREYRLKVSMKEWLDLMAALDKGLCGPSLLGFYHLSRTVLVKSEADYDKFDLAFATYFKDVKTATDIPKEVWEWLSGKGKTKDELFDKIDPDAPLYGLNELQDMLAKRLEEQHSRHSGGNYWIGTEGTSPLGHGGFAKQGIRVGGESAYRSALQVAEQRSYRDFRQDNILDTRQFQLAFRRLRQHSSLIEAPKTELDIGATIDATTDSGGILKLVFDKPRKNMIKLLLLFDSDGSMARYSRLCSALFQSVNKSNHFKDLKVYYFHNCIYEHLYTTPHCIRGEWIDTEWVLKNLGSEYRLIFVGDGAMAPSELLSPGGNCLIGLYNEIPGIEWLDRFKNKYPHHIWLNPIPEVVWDSIFGRYTLRMLKEMFPMYELSLEGLENGIKKLLVNR